MKSGKRAIENATTNWRFLPSLTCVKSIACFIIATWPILCLAVIGTFEILPFSSVESQKVSIWSTIAVICYDSDKPISLPNFAFKMQFANIFSWPNSPRSKDEKNTDVKRRRKCQKVEKIDRTWGLVVNFERVMYLYIRPKTRYKNIYTKSR